MGFLFKVLRFVKKHFIFLFTLQFHLVQVLLPVFLTLRHLNSCQDIFLHLYPLLLQIVDHLGFFFLFGFRLERVFFPDYLFVVGWLSAMHRTRSFQIMNTWDIITHHTLRLRLVAIALRFERQSFNTCSQLFKLNLFLLWNFRPMHLLHIFVINISLLLNFRTLLLFSWLLLQDLLFLFEDAVHELCMEFAVIIRKLHLNLFLALLWFKSVLLIQFFTML